MASQKFQIFIVILAFLVTLSATDIILPSLPSMTIYFEASEEAIQMVIPIYLLGSLLAAPILGIFSDYFGRKPVMLSGMAIFLFGTAMCIYSSSLDFFLIGRFLQGYGAIVTSVVGWAQIQDLYPTDESAKIMSLIGSVICIAPLCAPGLGGYIHITYGWKANFLFIFLLAIIVFILLYFSKTKVEIKSTKKKLSLLSILNIYINIITDKHFLCNISFFALLNCGEWCYLTLSPFYFENVLHLSPNIFGLYLSCSASFYIMGAFLTPIILNWLGINKTLALGIAISLMGSSILLCISFLAPSFPLIIVIAVGLYIFGAAVIWGPSNSRALQRFEDARGAASAVRIFLLTASCGLGGLAGSLLDASSLIPLALFLLATTIACGIIFQKMKKLESQWIPS